MNINQYLPEELAHHDLDSFDRDSSLGGTDIGAIHGVNKYLSSYQVWQNKRGEGQPIEDNALMEWGRRNEAAVIKKLSDTHPVWHKVFIPEQDYPGVMSLSDQRIHASPDGFALTDEGLVLLEAKTASYFSRNMWGESGSQVYPLHYRYQIQWYMHITGVSRAYLGVLIGGNDYREYVVERNDDLITTMDLCAAEFWEHVHNNTPPIPSKPGQMKDYLLDTRGESSDEFVPASSDHDAKVQELARIDEATKKLSEKKLKIHNELKDFIKDKGAKGIQHDNWKATWSTSESEKISGWKGYAADLEQQLPDGVLDPIRQQHTKVTKSDRLTISKKKGGKK